jgi:protein tyrosine phosphatase (PTP) superfamily phosphohydrolase (DUF442 family)
MNARQRPIFSNSNVLKIASVNETSNGCSFGIHIEIQQICDNRGREQSNSMGVFLTDYCHDFCGRLVFLGTTANSLQDISGMNRRHSNAASALLVALCVAVGGCASSATVKVVEKSTFKLPTAISPGPQRPMDDYVPGVVNFGMISPTLWRGAQPTAEGLQALAAAGVKTVIDLREDDESADIPKGVHYIRLPASAWRSDGFDVLPVLKAIDDSPKPVFIHCREGRDRTGLAIAAYRLSHGMSVANTCQELENFHVNPWWRSLIEQRIHQLDRQKFD